MNTINDTKLQAQVNEAIVGVIESWWSSEVERTMQDRYGATVRDATRSVYDAAMNCPVDWRTATMDFSLDTLHAYLTTHYPWLPPEARTRLNYCFIMTWK